MEKQTGLCVWLLVVQLFLWRSGVFVILTTSVLVIEDLLLQSIPWNTVLKFPVHIWFMYIFYISIGWNCRYFLKAGYSVIFLYRRFVSSALLCITIILISSLWKKVYAPDWIFKAIKLNICRGTCQPFCRSLPEDPLLECFTSTDDSNSQGLLIFHLCSIKMHKIFSF